MATLALQIVATVITLWLTFCTIGIVLDGTEGRRHTSRSHNILILALLPMVVVLLAIWRPW